MQTMPKRLLRIEMDKQAMTSFMVGRHSISFDAAEVALHVKNAALNSVPAPHNHNIKTQQQALRGGSDSSLADAPIKTKMALAKLT